MSKTALVIGGAGFLGSEIVSELLAAGWNVTNLGRGNKPGRADVPLIMADRTQDGALGAAIKGREFDLVVDCAAFNAADAGTAVDAFRGKIAHYIFISTDFVYIAREDATFPTAEDAPKQTVLPYGVGKLAAEEVLMRAHREEGFPATALRPPHILGKGRALGCEFTQMRDPAVLEKIRGGTGLVLTADGQLLVQPVWHREIGACIGHLAGMAGAMGEIFNITSADCVTTRRYYEIVAEETGVALKYESIALDEARRRTPDRTAVMRHRIYDLSRLAGKTGYRPRFGLREMLVETMEWMRKGESLPLPV